MIKKRVSLSLTIVLTVAVCVGALRRHGQGSEIPVSRAGVTPAPPESGAASSGRVEGASETLRLAFGMEGLIKSVTVHEGQAVAAGQLLARLECDDLEAEVQAAAAEVDSKRWGLERLLRGSREEERREAAQQAASALSVMKEAESRFARRSVLFEEKEISVEDMERAKSELEVAQAAHRAAAEREALINATPLPEERSKAESDLASASNHRRALLAKLQKCTIRAPIDGVVLQRHLQAGELFSFATQEPVLTIADVSRLHVRAEVDERDVARVRLGQKAVISADAFGESTYEGRVTSIGSMMGRKRVRSGDPAEKSDRDVLEVILAIRESDPALKVGLRVSVRFLQ